MSELDLPMKTRSRTYAQLVGVVVAMLSVGLVIPIAVGERAEESTLATDALDDLDLGAAGTGAPDSGVSSSTTSPGAVPVGGSPTPESSSGSTGSTGTESAGPSTTAPSASGELTASDVGVTEDTIKIGLLVPTSDTVGSTTDQRDVQVAEFEAFTEEINSRGGIHGRRIELVDATYDVLDQDSGTRASCLRLADDEKVFAAFNTTGYGPPGTLCLTREKGVPFLQGSGHPDEIYVQSNGLYSSTFDSQTRNFRNMVKILHDLGALRGKKVGVLGTEWLGLRREQEEGIVDTLRSLGYDPFVYWLSGDPVSSQTQVPIAVQQMRSRGVDAVLIGADFVSAQSFVQLGSSQGYRPFYGAADPWSYSTDQVVANMPASFDGAITTTAWRTYDHRAGVPEPAIDAECARIFEQSSGIAIDRAKDPNAIYTGTMLACGVVRRFEQAALAAGPNLTRAGLVEAIAGLGTVDIPYAGGPGTYGRGKLDGADFYRPQRWKASCKCWHPLVPEFNRGSF